MIPTRKIRKNTRGKSVKKRVERTIRSRIPGFLGAVIRWGILLFIVVSLIGSVSSRRTYQDEVERLASELTDLQREQSELQSDLENFSDPEWRECYWKWRTMRHEPGEYFIDFIEPGTL
jgi:hypothetical protein